MKFLLTILFLGGCLHVFGQTARAKDAYEKGQTAFANRDIAEARTQYTKAIERDPTYGEAFFKLAQLAEYDRNLEKAEALYREAITHKPDAPETQTAYQWLGAAALKRGDYTRALPLIERFLIQQKKIEKPSPLQKITLRRAERQAETCRFAENAMKNPVALNVRRLSDTVNRFESQYFPVMTADRQTLLFTGIANENGDENLYIAHRDSLRGWLPPQTIAEINTTENEGTASLSADGRVLVFTACQSRLRRGFGNCDLYVSYRQKNAWTAPENLGQEINSGAWESQPSLSSDGRLLFFVSDRPGGSGKRDIWLSRRDSLGRWLPALNAGAIINTTDDDVSPFLHANGKSLFFASDGRTGMGGFDIWLSDYDGTGFTIPENLGFPLNNHEDQVALFITADGTKGYYSQEARLRTDYRQSRIWELDVPPNLAVRFKKARFLKGIITDFTTKKPLAATLELVNLTNKKREALLTTDATTGEYATVLAMGGEYALFVNSKGYLFKSLSFDFSENGQDKVLNISLEALKKNAVERLNNVFFASGKWDIQEKSFPELNKLLGLMQENPALRLEVSGHTDDVGDDRKNQELSLKRANAVVEYLLKNGIATSRVQAMGYGETRPALPNTTEENRRFNRRIEVSLK